MKVGKLGVQLRPQRRLPKISTILMGLVGFVIFSPLTACVSVGNVPTVAAGPIPQSMIGAPTAPSQTTAWKLVWDDEFHGPKGAGPDLSKWTPEIGNGINGWGNQQLEYNTDTNQNVYQDGQGHLVLEARQENPNGYKCWNGPCKYTSAHLTTDGHFNFTYGRFEAKIKLPPGVGIWPAFWLDGSNCATVGWPQCGEIDIMEHIGIDPAIAYGEMHGPENVGHSYVLPKGVFSDDFHTFALEWSPTALYYFVDGINYLTIYKSSLKNPADWVYDHSFNLVLNMAVGGWGGSPTAATVFPEKMYVSYVRVYTNT